MPGETSPIFMPDKVPRARIRPVGLLTRILWKLGLIHLNVRIVYVKNPVKEMINKETNLFGVLPKVPWTEFGPDHEEDDDASE